MGKLQNEPLDLALYSRPSWLSQGGAVVFSGDEASVPAHQGVGSDDASELIESLPA
jgi:hypothetical protein